MADNKLIIPVERIEQRIYLIRGLKVMLSPDLAEFQQTDEEFSNLKSQIVISSWGEIRRAKPYAFTEQGVAMLSSILRSKRVVQVNIAIMRTFVRLREMLASNTELASKLATLERKYDEQFAVVFEAIRQLMAPPATPRRRIGFKAREKRAAYSVKKKRKLGK